MKRRDVLISTGAAVLGLSAVPFRQAAAADAHGGKIYHIDPLAGTDDADGLAPSRAWKTYASREFRGGDTVLLKRGSVFRGVLHTRNGTDQAPVTYGAYGEGAKPVFLGSVPANDPEHWVQERPSVWRYTGAFPSEVCNVVFNDGESCGILRWRIEDLQQPGDWHYTGIGMHSADGSRGDPDGVLYLCSAANPVAAYASIECVLWGARRMVGGSHVILDNLSFRNSGVHGYFQVGARNVVIRNCEFRFIGGAVWSLKHRVRFGNAIEFWDGAADCTVEGCLFDNIYDSAVTHQGGGTRNIPKRLYFRDNLFIDCGLCAYEHREPAKEVYFEYNTCIHSGGGFSMQGKSPPRPSDPYPQPVGYHVFIFYIEPGTQPGPAYIRHNLFYESHGAAISAIIDPVDERKFVIDHNGYWQTTGELLMQLTRLREGKTTPEAIQTHLSTGQPWPLDLWRSCRPSEFPRYQAESGQDRHSRVAQPLFVDQAGGDYRQRPDSPCSGMGMRTHVRREMRPGPPGPTPAGTTMIVIKPGVPIRITEWGASYHTSNEPQSVINGNYAGAVWAAAFLNAMLHSGVDAALYLVTTDLRQPVKDAPGKFENVWGWPSLFVNPHVFGSAYPKAPYHVFEMVSRLAGSRVEATRGERTVNCIATADREAKRITVLVWNYGLRVPESGTPVENAQREGLVLRVGDAGAFFGSRSVRMRRWMVADGVGDAHALFVQGRPLDAQKTALQELDNGTFVIRDDQIDIGFAAPPSSVSLVELGAE